MPLSAPGVSSRQSFDSSGFPSMPEFSPQAIVTHTAVTPYGKKVPSWRLNGVCGVELGAL